MNPVVLDQIVRQQEEIESLRQQLAEKESQRQELMMAFERQGNSAQEVITELRQQLSAAQADAERYRWLRDRLFGADWDWNGEGVPVVLFRWPESASIGANLDAAIDAATEPK